MVLPLLDLDVTSPTAHQTIVLDLKSDNQNAILASSPPPLPLVLLPFVRDVYHQRLDSSRWHRLCLPLPDEKVWFRIA